MKFTSPNMVPYQTFSEMKPEDFNAKNLEEIIWGFGCGEQFDSNIYYPPEKQDYYSGIRAWQLPCQLADFLEYLYANKDEMKISSYLELGACYGGLFYIMDSFFRAINPDYEESVCLDIFDKVFEFRNYKKRFKTVDFVLSDSLNYRPKRKFDLIFVDDLHTYEHVTKEFQLYKNHANYMAFHDIDNPPYAEGVIQLWNEIKSKYPNWETTRRYVQELRIMGIGLIRLVK